MNPSVLAADAALAKVPPAGCVSFDHAAHFVPDIEAASAALERLGFTLTPFSAQSHRVQPGGPLVPAGTGNRCVMFERGYLEFLTPTGDTVHAAELRAAIRRYVGIHLIAFGTATPEADYARLEQQGFEPLAPVALQRPIATETAESTARFCVVRVPPGTMAEGRIQFCHHLTPELLWQRRWIRHPNGTTAANGVVICSIDPREAAQRYSRYTGLPVQRARAAWRLDTARGSVHFLDAQVLRRVFGFEAPTLPWIAASILETSDLAETQAALMQGGGDVVALPNERLLVRLPPSIGGFFLYERTASGPLEFE